MDRCFIAEALEVGDHTPVARHLEFRDNECKPALPDDPVPQTVLSRVFWSILTPSEQGSLANLEALMLHMTQELQTIWLDHTSSRTLEEEIERPLHAMAIVALNRCAINLVEYLMPLRGFRLQPLLVSVCIGWASHTKRALQGRARMYQPLAHKPWTALHRDLPASIDRVVELVALLRFASVRLDRLEAIRRDDASGQWVGTPPTPVRMAPADAVQGIVNVLVCLLSSGRLTADGNRIAPAYIIPKYNISSGYLYKYFAGINREMMCQASTTLVASLLSTTFRDEAFGVETMPGHIYAVLLSSDGTTYTPIETTVFNAEAYASIGSRYVYNFARHRRRRGQPYVYIPRGLLQDTLTHVAWAMDHRLATTIRLALPEFPYDQPGDNSRSTEVSLGVVAVVCSADTVTVQFAHGTRSEVLHLFLRRCVHEYLAGSRDIVPVGYGADASRTENRFYTTNCAETYTAYADSETYRVSIRNMVGTVTLGRLVGLAGEYRLALVHTTMTVHTGVKQRPSASTTTGISSAILHNMVVTVTGDLHGRGQVVLHDTDSIPVRMRDDPELIAIRHTLATMAVRNLPSSSTVVLIRTDVSKDDVSRVVTRFNRWRQDRYLSASIEAVFIPETTAGDSQWFSRDIVCRHAPLHMDNNFGDNNTTRRSISDLVSYEWWEALTNMSSSLENNAVRTMLDDLPVVGTRCRACRQKRVHGMRGVAHSRFTWLSRLSRPAQRRGVRRKPEW